MPDLNTPYLERSPGDLITAEDWNDLQRRVRRDIGETTKAAVEQITRVQSAGNADKLDGKSLNELTDELVRRAVQAIRAESGYRQLFKVLRVGEETPIKHDLHLFPLVDIYQLDYFQVVCCEDKDTYPTWVTFYLHHENEESVRYAKDNKRGSLAVQPERGQRFRLPFSEMLSRYGVRYDDGSSLGDVESDFWPAFFADSDPRFRFTDDQYCHSPWFDKCCREEKTVGEARRNGDWDNLFIEMRPRKTINYPAAVLARNSDNLISLTFEDPELTAFIKERRLANGDFALPVEPAPTQVQVTQYDFDTLGLTLLTNPVYPAEVFQPANAAGPLDAQIPGVRKELKVMVLLKV